MKGQILSEYEFRNQIGNGNFSVVYKGVKKATGEVVAIKQMKSHLNIAIKEAILLKKFNHPNIIKLHLFEKLPQNNESLMVLEYTPQNILELYESQYKGLKEEQVKCIFFQCCLGLHHFHQRGVVHRDIKPENIMIDRSKAEIKIIDFGLAIEQNLVNTDYVATRWYRAPENLLGTKEYTTAIDIFSLGCVLVEIFNGVPLFPGSDNIDQLCKIFSVLPEPTQDTWKNGHHKFKQLGLKLNAHGSQSVPKVDLGMILSSASPRFAHLIEKMLTPNPFDRITAAEILKNEYFDDIKKIVPPLVYQTYETEILKSKSKKVYQSRDKRFYSEPKYATLNLESPVSSLSKIKNHRDDQKTTNNTIDQEKNQPTIAKNNSLTESSFKSMSNRNLIGNERVSAAKSFSDIRSQIEKGNAKAINTPKPHPSEIINDQPIQNSLRKNREGWEEGHSSLNKSLTKIKSSSDLLGSDSNVHHKIVFPLKKNLNSGASIKSNNQRPKDNMLSFRGLNFQRQKIVMRQGCRGQGNNFYPRGQQSGTDVKNSSKNQKVIDYLAQFNNPPAGRIRNLDTNQRQNELNQTPKNVSNLSSAPKNTNYRSIAFPKNQNHQKITPNETVVNKSRHLSLDSKSSSKSSLRYYAQNPQNSASSGNTPRMERKISLAKSVESTRNLQYEQRGFTQSQENQLSIPQKAPSLKEKLRYFKSHANSGDKVENNDFCNTNNFKPSSLLNSVQIPSTKKQLQSPRIKQLTKRQITEVQSPEAKAGKKTAFPRYQSPPSINYVSGGSMKRTKQCQKEFPGAEDSSVIIPPTMNESSSQSNNLQLNRSIQSKSKLIAARDFHQSSRQYHAKNNSSPNSKKAFNFKARNQPEQNTNGIQSMKSDSMRPMNNREDLNRMHSPVRRQQDWTNSQRKADENSASVRNIDRGFEQISQTSLQPPTTQTKKLNLRKDILVQENERSRFFRSLQHREFYQRSPVHLSPSKPHPFDIAMSTSQYNNSNQGSKSGNNSVRNSFNDAFSNFYDKFPNGTQNAIPQYYLTQNDQIFANPRQDRRNDRHALMNSSQTYSSNIGMEASQPSALSQLRESITGIYNNFSDRDKNQQSQKDININLNLNIYHGKRSKEKTFSGSQNNHVKTPKALDSNIRST